MQRVSAMMPRRNLTGPSPEAEKVIVLTRKDLARCRSVAEEVILGQPTGPVA